MRVKHRPVLRYHGGKWVLAPWIIGHFPEHRVYVEPYAGAASVLLRKERSYCEVYNDRDDEIVNVFRVLQERKTARELKRLLQLTPFARREFELSYENHCGAVERARRTIIRSFMGFGSDGIWRKTGFRANSNRSGTTPAHDWRNYPRGFKAASRGNGDWRTHADGLDWYVERLRGVVIENRDALEVMAQHDSPNTLFYVDPPYVHQSRGDDKQYRHEMKEADHRALITALHALKGRVVLSGYPSELYAETLKRWRRVERPSLADGARKRTEVLWMNFA